MILAPCICGPTQLRDVLCISCLYSTKTALHKVLGICETCCASLESACTVLHKAGDGCPHDPAASSLLLLPPTWQQAGNPNVACSPDSHLSITRIGTSVCHFVLLIFHSPVSWTITSKCAIQDDRLQVAVDHAHVATWPAHPDLASARVMPADESVNTCSPSRSALPEI